MTATSSSSDRIAAQLAGLDHFRRSPSRLAGRREHKEWQHFLVHTAGAHLLVNFSLIDDPWGAEGRSPEVARLIVLARAASWDGDVERFDERDVEVTPGRIDARFGRSSMRFHAGRYHLSVALADRPIAAEIDLVPTSSPALSLNRPLSRERSLSWLFVPRLEASGSLTLDGHVERFERAPAYHDHNWGHFLWGDDFSWEWGSALPGSAASPWSAVHVRMLDRGRAVARYQGLFLYREDEPFHVFRDEQIEVAFTGRLAAARPLRIPRVMTLLAPESAADLPARIEITARDGVDELHLIFEAEDVAQVLMPSEADLEGVVTLHELSGRVVARGRVGGEDVTLEGPGVFELIRA